MRILKKLKSRRGLEQILYSMVIAYLFMVLVSFGIEVTGVVVQKKGIEDMATETARYIELRGAVNDAVYNEFERLKSVTGVECELEVDGDFSSGQTLQLEAPFTVTVTTDTHLLLLDIPLVAKATGRSEVYHK